jgi:hypothetical protein
MKAGVSTFPCGVLNTPCRARPSRALIAKPKREPLIAEPLPRVARYRIAIASPYE